MDQLTPEQIRTIATAAAEAEREKYDPDSFLPLTSKDTAIKDILLEEPEPIDAILYHNDQPFLPKGIVAMISGEGGVSKSFFLIELSFALATGTNFGPIKAVNPVKVLFLAAEDSQHELYRRLWNSKGGYFPANFHAFSIAGKAGPIMELKDGNPVRSEWYNWLDITIENHKGVEILVLDPKSRIYGLEENNNNHATQWIAALERLSIKHGITILFSNHVSKGAKKAYKMTQDDGRGASAIVDGCRWCAGMRQMDENTGNSFGVQNYRDYVEFDITKSNYTPKLPASMYFERGPNGILKYVPLQDEQMDSMARELRRILKEDELRYSSRDLAKEKRGEPVYKAMKLVYENFKRKDFGVLVNYCLKNNILHEIRNNSGSSNKPSFLLEAVF